MTNPKHRYRILFVDDDAGNLNFLKLAFRGDYLVKCASDGEEAWEILRKDENKDIALILSDERMPGISGTDLLKKSVETHPDTIRMLITAFPDVNDSIYDRKEIEVDMYIRKPIREKIQELRDIIRNAVWIYELRRENQFLNEEVIDIIENNVRIRNLFSKYLPPDAIKKFETKDPKSLKQSEERVVTILHSDIRGFTALSERLRSSPKELVNFLNDYFGVMSEVINGHHGCIDKYIGDAIMATFGVKDSEIMDPKKDAQNAVKCALKMRELLKEFNRAERKSSIPDIHFGIGINTGTVVLGNIGSDYLLDYTVIGDAVNMASRIENLTCKTPDAILIGKTTFEYTKDIIGSYKEKKPRIRIGDQMVPIQVYDIFDLKTEK